MGLKRDEGGCTRVGGITRGIEAGVSGGGGVAFKQVTGYLVDVSDKV